MSLILCKKLANSKVLVRKPNMIYILTLNTK